MENQSGMNFVLIAAETPANLILRRCVSAVSKDGHGRHTGLMILAAMLGIVRRGAKTHFSP